jgi:hypothetical protein
VVDFAQHGLGRATVADANHCSQVVRAPAQPFALLSAQPTNRTTCRRNGILGYAGAGRRRWNAVGGIVRKGTMHKPEGTRPLAGIDEPRKASSQRDSATAQCPIL